MNTEQSVDRYSSLVTGLTKYFCTRKLPASIDIEDLRQEGFVRMLELSKNHDENISNFTTHASHPIYGAMVDHVRSARPGARAQIKPRFCSLDALCDVPEDSQSGIDALVSVRILSHLLDSIDALPPAQRIVTRLHYLDGWRLKDVGEALGVGESRACQISKEAVVALRVNMAGWV